MELAQLYPESNIFLLDANDGARKIVDSKELGFGGFEALPNLVYYPCDKWDRSVATETHVGVLQAYEDIKKLHRPGDFVCMDTAGDLRDLARDFYCETMYKMSYDKYTFTEKMKKGTSTSLSFGGLDSDEWGIIGGIHDGVVWHAFHRLDCNVILTTQVRQIVMKNVKNVQTGQNEQMPLEKGLDEAWVKLGVYPESDKKVPTDVDTVLYLDVKEKPKAGKMETVWTARYVAKDRGQKVSEVRQFDFDTNTPFWVAYCESKGLDVGKAPGST